MNKAGGTYSVVGDFLIPDLALPEQETCFFGRYCRLHGDYLKSTKIAFIESFYTLERSMHILAEIGANAKEMLENLTREMAEKQGVSEQLKATKQMAWVGAMNSIKACAKEIVLNEIIYT